MKQMKQKWVEITTAMKIKANIYSTVQILLGVSKPVTAELHWRLHSRPVQQNHKSKILIGNLAFFCFFLKQQVLKFRRVQHSPMLGKQWQSWILDSMPWIPDSKYWILVFVSGTNVTGIPDSLNCILDSKSQDSRFHKHIFPGFLYMGQLGPYSSTLSKRAR